MLDARVAAPPTTRAEVAVARILALATRCVSESVERPAMAEVVSELHGALRAPGGAGICRRRRDASAGICGGGGEMRARPPAQPGRAGATAGGLCGRHQVGAAGGMDREALVWGKQTGGVPGEREVGVTGALVRGSGAGVGWNLGVKVPKSTF